MKKIIIIGKALGWQLAPKEGEAWGLNDLIMNRELSLLFNVHKSIPKIIIDKCNQNNVSIVTLQKNDLVNNNIIYPLKEIIEDFNTDLFTNSIDYMIAYAIYKKYEQIDIYGVSMGSVYEYKFQKPSLEFWIGYALGKGIKINIFGDENSKLKIKGNICYPMKFAKNETNVKLGVFERVTLLNILSTNIYFNRNILDKIRFTGDEEERLKFENKESSFCWIGSEDKDIEINLNINEQSIISNLLIELNKIGLLNQDHEKIYKKFVI